MHPPGLPFPPGPPHAGLKQRVLATYQENPFQDEDDQGLSVRLGVARTDLVEALDGLCEDHFLKLAGQRGYMLDLEFPAAAEPEVAGLPVAARPDETPDAAWHPIADPPDASLVDLVESLPFGVILLRPTGERVLSNQRAAAWLDLPPAELDGAGLARATGFDPIAVASGSPARCFSLREPRALEITVRSCCPGAAGVVMVVIQDASLQEEVALVQAQFQEELFASLRRELVIPLRLIRRFLENPDAAELGPARAALEQVTWFLEDLYLAGPGGSECGDSEGPDAAPPAR